MCGLIAAWDRAGLADAPLSRALQDLRHRGPDAQAETWREQHQLYLAHARLKVIDTSEGANQPFLSPCGRWALAYNGEIYNYRKIRAEIGDRWDWRTQSDTEVLMAAWSLWGEACLDRLVGMFAFALHDDVEHTLTLVRDRFGIKPLYHLAQGARHVFASEIRPLLRFMPSIKADASTIRIYLEEGSYEHSRQTFFAGVESIAPGSLVAIDLSTGGARARRWYDLQTHVPDLSGMDEEELLSRADELVSQAITSHLVADVGVGLNVSGGVDSSMLVRTTVEALGHAHLFTQNYEGYSELPWVREVSEGGTLHVANLTSEHIEAYLNGTVASQGEPFGGVFVCGYNALYEMAVKEGVTVLLDGNGVDEVFLGYKRYHQIYATDTTLSDRERGRRAGDFKAFWGSDPRPADAGASIDGTNGLCASAISDDLRRVPVGQRESVGTFSDPVRQAAAEDLLQIKIPRGLRFNDRVSMAHSRELRVPYLDHRLVEFGFGLSPDLLLGKRGSKVLFRRLLARRAPDSVAFAAKRSIQSPQREWLGRDWHGMVMSVLKSKSFSERNWVDPGRAMAAYEAYCAGAQDNSFFIWQWLNLELWARAYLDGAIPE